MSTTRTIDTSFDEWVRLDFNYVDHWSLIVDFMLIAKTVPVVIHGRNAA